MKRKKEKKKDEKGRKKKESQSVEKTGKWHSERSVGSASALVFRLSQTLISFHLAPHCCKTLSIPAYKSNNRSRRENEDRGGEMRQR